MNPSSSRKLITLLLTGALVSGSGVCPGVGTVVSLAATQDASSAASSAVSSVEEEESGQSATEAKESSEAPSLAASKKKAKKAAAKAVKAQKQSSKTSSEKQKASKGKKAKAAAKKAKKARQRQIVKAVAYLNTLESQLETATEDLAQITEKRKKAEKRVKQARKSLKAAKYTLAHAQTSLDTTVKEIYKNGSLSYLSVLFGSNDFEDFASRLYLLETIASKREQEVSASEGLKASYEAKLAEYEESLGQQEELEKQAQERNQTITDSIDSQLKLVGSLDSTMLAAVNDYDSVKATRKWLAKYGGSKSKKGSHPEIVSIASAYLGVPYVWGGETPQGFDCSGLVMYCYAQIGIDLPHNARSQYDCGKHISAAALMPGDLVFFGPDVEGIHHVGIYVGDGKYLQAPRTGDVVKVSRLSDRSDYVGACRPSS